MRVPLKQWKIVAFRNKIKKPQSYTRLNCMQPLWVVILFRQFRVSFGRSNAFATHTYTTCNVSLFLSFIFTRNARTSDNLYGLQQLKHANKNTIEIYSCKRMWLNIYKNTSSILCNSMRREKKTSLKWKVRFIFPCGLKFNCMLIRLWFININSYRSLTMFGLYVAVNSKNSGF